MKTGSTLPALVTFLFAAYAAAGAYSEHEQNDVTRATVTERVASEGLPAAPTSLSQPSSLLPEKWLKGLDKHGDAVCHQLRRVAKKLPEVETTLSPASATLAKRSVRLSHVFCDANEKFIGYPATGNRNEKFVVDYYTIVYFLTIAPQLAQKVVPGVESNMALFDMRQTKEELETNFLMGGGGYKRAIENAYKTMSDTELRNALLQYEQWSYALGRYYEDKQ